MFSDDLNYFVKFHWKFCWDMLSSSLSSAPPSSSPAWWKFNCYKLRAENYHHNYNYHDIHNNNLHHHFHHHHPDGNSIGISCGRRIAAKLGSFNSTTLPSGGDTTFLIIIIIAAVIIIIIIIIIAVTIISLTSCSQCFIHLIKVYEAVNTCWQYVNSWLLIVPKSTWASS